MSEGLLQCSKTRGCTNPGIKCAANKCSKVICEACYLAKVFHKNKFSSDDALPMGPSGQTQVACTKKCHEAVKRLATNGGEPSRIPWDTDTPNGEYQGSSEALLIDWLKTEGNYSRWRGNKEGISKQRQQQIIADSLNNDGIKKGIVRNRTEKQVGAKIQQIERNYRDTLAWKNNTGQGIMEEQGLDESTFRDLVIQRWRHFYDLNPIFQDRSCMGPVIHSDDLDDNLFTSDDESVHNQCEDHGTSPNQTANSTTNHENNEAAEDPGGADDVDINENTSDGDAGTGTPSPTGHIFVPGSATDDVSVDESPVVEARRSATPSIASSGKRKSQASNTSRRGRSKIQSFDIVKSLFDQIDRSKGKSSDLGERELLEKKRHNQVMENIELQKSQAAVFQAADAEMDYQLKLKAQYDRMKDDNKDDEWIAQTFPQLICFFDTSEMTDAKKAMYTEKYNKWNQARHLPGRM